MTDTMIEISQLVTQARLARCVVDSYTVRAEHMVMLIRHIFMNPHAPEAEFHEWLEKMVGYYPSHREITAIVRAVRFRP